MFTHIVTFEWNDDVPEGHADTARAALEAYARTLDGCISYACGPDAGLGPDNADFAVVAVFENEAAWHAYDTADEHNRIRAEVFRPWVARRSAVQIRG
ncbi:MAG: Dabb family protein [Acidimicrobiales bacterium]